MEPPPKPPNPAAQPEPPSQLAHHWRSAYTLEGYGSDGYGGEGYGGEGYGGGEGHDAEGYDGEGYGGEGYGGSHTRRASRSAAELAAEGYGTPDRTEEDSWRPSPADEAHWKLTHYTAPTHNELVEDAPEGDGWASVLSPGYHPRLRPTEAGTSAGFFGLFAAPTLGESFCLGRAAAAADEADTPLPRPLHGESLRSARARALGEPGMPQREGDPYGGRMSPPVE